MKTKADLRREVEDLRGQIFDLYEQSGAEIEALKERLRKEREHKAQAQAEALVGEYAPRIIAMAKDICGEGDGGRQETTGDD